MSVSVPRKHLASKCLFSNPLPIRSRAPQRHASIFGGGRGSDDNSSSKDDGAPTSRPNPVLEEYRRRNPENASQQQQRPQQPAQRGGDLAASSIFEDDRRTQAQQERDAAARATVGEEQEGVRIGGQKRDPSNLARVLDPDPNARERWERKKVIQMLRRGGRLNHQQFVKRTEREHLVKSHNMKTSIKKLGMLARQIAGKTVDEAIAQMRFSKKKVAGEILKQLEYARDEAVVTRGMGLGMTETGSAANGIAVSRKDVVNDGTPLQIQLKDGKRHIVADASTMYIDQAWVGRGPYGQLPDYRARGKVYIMRTPWTSLTVLLKEEKTRIREYEEREEKRKKEVLGKVWTQLPDRPVQWQRQWYGW